MAEGKIPRVALPPGTSAAHGTVVDVRDPADTGSAPLGAVSG